jgi:hypothetical protein
MVQTRKRAGKLLTPSASLEAMQMRLNAGKGKIEHFSIDNGCLNLKLGGKSFPALVDTGATISAIKASFLHGLVDLGPVKIKPCHLVIYLADNSTAVCTQTVCLNFKIGETTYEQEFRILKDLSRPVILGVDFLEKYQANLSFDNSEELKSISQPVVSLSTCSIPPYYEATFGGKVNSSAHYTHTDVGLCENWDRGEEHMVKYLVKGSLVSPSKTNDIMLSLLNCTGNALHVTKGEIVVLYVPQKLDSLICIQKEGSVSTISAG